MSRAFLGCAAKHFTMCKRGIGFPFPWFLVCFLLIEEGVAATKKLHVVYLGAHPHTRETLHLVNHEDIMNDHHELLGSAMGSKDKAKQAIVRSSTNIINAFAANLDEGEVASLKKNGKVISVFPSRKVKFHTNNAFAFVGLEEKSGNVPDNSLWKKTNYGEDVIVGILDSGIWPESKSFADDGIGPVPSRWKGVCVADGDMHCNRKIIGARYFLDGEIESSKADNTEFKKEWLTARAREGDWLCHGNRAASCSVGNFVPNVSIIPNEPNSRIAKGSAPKARISMYTISLYDTDFLMGIDAAISDGVDLIHYECGAADGYPYEEDLFAIGTLHAILHGIPVVSTAGNDHVYGNVSNGFPWVTTVGAVSTDRNVVTELVLGNNKRLKGFGTGRGSLADLHPLIDGLSAMKDDVSKTPQYIDAGRKCAETLMDPIKLKGKILVCEFDWYDVDGSIALKLGAAGRVFVLARETDPIAPADQVLPAVQLYYKDSQELLSYMTSDKSAQATITEPTVEYDPDTPLAWAFPSKGPSNMTAEIIKPDIAGPGPLLASVPPQDKTTREPGYFQSTPGTSFTGPAVAGMAAVLKAAHPEWSPSELKSALMTTATVVRESESLDGRGNLGLAAATLPLKEDRIKANPFQVGSGLANPNKADDPGLVYKTEDQEYLLYLCAKGIGSENILKMTHGYQHAVDCPANPPKVYDMNYPSIGVTNLSDPTTVTRRVKNVGDPSTYKVTVEQPEGILVTVNPTTLNFDKVGQEQVFTVTLAVNDRNAVEQAAWDTPSGFVFGSLTWTDGKHDVRSPIAVHVKEMPTVQTRGSEQLSNFLVSKKKMHKFSDSDL